ncbi:galactose-binding domain-containing protein [Mucilaginibacter gotjawali]|uniref:F5/8 type C domain protein n=2 Tax=Mucilaginibacter gotjawali TaxID=1550579 RepID=A0A110B1E2_9SPHI|nr:discoidin domain-containing protein [Mucilaginibacter gotjawali]MBB3057276.1 hypothetical protein [Mucilaginibacter gotjawali]BAU52956.1 F5/8 type C domain protein [Mucilaginibacter gotjawali]
MKRNLLVTITILIGMAVACKKQEGAKPYDPNTKITFDVNPKIKSFLPDTGKTGDTILIKGINFNTASGVSFGSMPATSFKILSDTTIKAVVGTGTSGTVSVTNAKGTRSLAGFRFIVPVVVVANPNLALNKPASGSANFNDPALAVDGNTGSFWQTKGLSNQWFKVDLQAVKNVNRVFISWDGAYATDFAIQVSSDDVTYTTVYANTAATGGDAGYTFKTVAARYIKVLLNKDVSSLYPVGIHELEVYNDPPPVNLALHKTGSAFASINDPGRALDGDYGSLWQAGGLTDQWYKVDLGSVQTVGSVKVFWDPGAYATDYTLQVSTDDVTYNTVYTNTAGTGGSDANVFTPVSARYVKILLNKDSSPYFISIFEFEVYKN